MPCIWTTTSVPASFEPRFLGAARPRLSSICIVHWLFGRGRTRRIAADRGATVVDAADSASTGETDPRGHTRAEFGRGVRDALPVGVGLIPLGMAFGVLIVQQGFAWYWAPLFSILIYAGSMEFLAIGLFLAGTPLTSLAVTGLLVNFRHIFYGLSYPLHAIRSRLARAYAVYALTDETYAIVATKPRGSMSGPRALAVTITCQALWVLPGWSGRCWVASSRRGCTVSSSRSQRCSWCWQSMRSAPMLRGGRRFWPRRAARSRSPSLRRTCWSSACRRMLWGLSWSSSGAAAAWPIQVYSPPAIAC